MHNEILLLEGKDEDDIEIAQNLVHLKDELENTKIQLDKVTEDKKYIELLPKINNEIIKITNHLYDNYHLYHNDLREKNICIDSNYIIRLIDFEYASSKLRAGEKKGAFKPYP